MRIPLRGPGLAIASLACATLLYALAGCGSPQRTVRPDALARLGGEQSSGAHSATPIFSPAIAAPAGDANDAPAQMLPIEAFNWRPSWPAASGVRLGEITVYREWYYDWQSSTSWGRGHVGGYFNRTFQSYRTGLIVK